MVNTLDAWNDTCVPLLLGVLWPDPTRCQEKRFTSMVPPGKGTATLMSRLKSKFKTRPSGDTVCCLLTQLLASTSTCLSVNLSNVYFSRNKPGNDVRRPWGHTKGLRFLWGQRGKEGGTAKTWICHFCLHSWLWGLYRGFPGWKTPVWEHNVSVLKPCLSIPLRLPEVVCR